VSEFHVFEMMESESEGTGGPPGLFDDSFIISTRYKDEQTLLPRTKRYRGVRDLKSKNLEFYRELLSKNLLATAMIQNKWKITPYEVVTIKQWVLAKAKESSKVLEYNSKSRNVNVIRLRDFIQNHTRYTHPCFDPDFAKKLHEIKFGGHEEA